MSQPLMSSHQPSLTEWFAAIGKEDQAKAMREEDNARHSRWETLYKLIGFPYDRPEIFEAAALLNPSPAFQTLLKERGSHPAAVRLVAKQEGLPKLRHRGPPLRECYDWFLKQEINHSHYLAEVYRHHENKAWSTTFVVHESGITGELIQGLHSQLTQGDTSHPLYQFNYDFNTWSWSENPGEGAKIIERIVNCIKVTDQATQQKIIKELQARFYNNYLSGYFEATVLDDGKFFFIDYNRLLGQNFPSSLGVLNFSTSDNQMIRGTSACGGQAIGPVCVIDLEKESQPDLNGGDILVCANTDVRYVPYMQRAAAIVTDQGSILSHAAIVSRELGKPCIVNTRVATKVLQDGEMVEVDAEKGAIKRLEKCI